MPRRLAIRSIVKHPRLGGVNWYSIPGLPKPTISFTQIGSWLLAVGLSLVARGSQLAAIFSLSSRSSRPSQPFRVYPCLWHPPRPPLHLRSPAYPSQLLHVHPEFPSPPPPPRTP